jgi:hypothetical protein
MIEQRRLEYLEAMGIDQFVPRKRLSHAKASVALLRTASDTAHAQPAPQQPLAESAPAQPLSNTASQAAAQAQTQVEAVRPSQAQAGPASIGQLLQQNPLLGESAAQIPSSQPSPTPGKQLRFALSLWHLDNWLIIDSRQSQSALPTDALLANIAFALGLPSPIPPADIIHWPLVETPQQPTGWDAAREMMNAFLRQRLNEHSRLLLLGEAAYMACSNATMSFQRALHSSPDDWAPQACGRWILAPSLAQLLQQPAQKALLWQRLQDAGIHNG